ncbi:MAG: hypothetical protein PUC21_10180 [Bacteroidales bacterium]|nr:hypothetical protein [Bacteroidales bacterium]
MLSTKKNMHITFTPLSNGSSLFTTDNEEIIDAIEHHYKFGKMFRLDGVEDSGEALESGEQRVESEEASEGETLKQVSVSDLAAAKDYLADKCGVSRTVLRSKNAIIEQAKAHQIEFVGL